MPKVKIVNSNITNLYETMFTSRGWEVVDTIEEADLVQFTGGSDIDPAIYEQAKHGRTYVNSTRDESDCAAYVEALSLKKPMAGICRGGQLLNALSGGRMYQHVDGHLSSHLAKCLVTGEVFEVTSTHHQMMRVGEGGRKLMCAGVSTNVEWMGKKGGLMIAYPNPERMEDTEAAYYEKTKCLCYQPHPEYGTSGDRCTEIYFYYIKELLGVG